MTATPSNRDARNDVVRERLVVQRIDGLARGRGKVARALQRQGRSRGGKELRLPDARALIRAEHEGAIADDRAAEREAELVLLEVGLADREKVAGVEFGVAQIFPERTVNLVGAGARGGHKQASAEASILGAEVAGHHFEFLQRVRRGQVEDGILQHALVLGSVEADFVLGIAPAGRQ